MSNSFVLFFSIGWLWVCVVWLQVGNANDQELVTDFFVCDYLNSLYGPTHNSSAVQQRIGLDVSLSQAMHYLPGCELSGAVKYGLSLDVQCRLFQSMHNSEVDQSIHAAQDLDVHVLWDTAHSAWRNKHTGSLPAIFHGNGGGKQHIEPVFAKLLGRNSNAGAGAAPPALDEYDRYFHFDNHPQFSYKATCVDRPPDR